MKNVCGVISYPHIRTGSDLVRKTPLLHNCVNKKSCADLNANLKLFRTADVVSLKQLFEVN